LVERACERLISEYCRLVDFGEAAAVADLFKANWCPVSGLAISHGPAVSSGANYAADIFAGLAAYLTPGHPGSLSG